MSKQLKKFRTFGADNETSKSADGRVPVLAPEERQPPARTGEEETVKAGPNKALAND